MNRQMIVYRAVTRDGVDVYGNYLIHKSHLLTPDGVDDVKSRIYIDSPDDITKESIVILNIIPLA